MDSGKLIKVSMLIIFLIHFKWGRGGVRTMSSLETPGGLVNLEVIGVAMQIIVSFMFLLFN